MAEDINRMTYCPVCRAEKVKFHKNVNGFLINKCLGCGLLWTEGVDNSTLRCFYNQKYFNLESKSGYRDYLREEKNHRKNARGILFAVDAIRDLRKTRILDIGCAFGFLLDEARRWKSCDVFGVEWSQGAHQYASKNLGLNVANSDVDELNFEPDFFDVVFLAGTIEHLVRPAETLMHIHRMLKAEGLLVITTLDTKGVIPFYSLKPPEHIYYFNHVNLALLLRNTGFHVLVKKIYFASYGMHDLLHRFGEFLSFRFLSRFSSLLERAGISMKIPTNEMLVIAAKTGAP